MTEKISGQIERVTFSNEETGFAVVSIKVPGQRELVPVVGILNNPVTGEHLELCGQFKIHPKFGQRFEVESFTSSAPLSQPGLRKYLGSGLIKGIGPVLAERMVNTFGSNVLDVLDKNPERLTEVSGLGPQRREKIIEAWKASTGLKRLLNFLAQFGLGPSLALRIFRILGTSAEDIIKADPYRLAYDISGVGFISADKVAKALGFAPEAKERIEAGLLYTLAESIKQGHDYLPSQELFTQSHKLIPEITRVLLEEGLANLTLRGKVIPVSQNEPGGQDIYLPRLYQAEIWTARTLLSIKESPFSTPVPRPEKALIWVEKDLGLNLNDDQKKAAMAAIGQKIVVVTGGPGTGKTTMTRAVSRIWKAVTPRIALVAPTGRAAKRLSQATGIVATTIHRLLEYSHAGGGFIRGPKNKLELDMLLVDEASMLDIILLNQLLGALPHQAALILVGDQDQLPSVGPGKALADIIYSGVAEVHRLNHIFRQSKESLIITAAHLVNSGQNPIPLLSQDNDDFIFIPEDEPNRLKDILLKLIIDEIPRKTGLTPNEDIQVLSPTRKGDLGTLALNSLISQALNPGHAPSLTRFGQTWRLGDRVMQTRNNYNRDVFNGDLGKIINLDFENQEMHVDFEDKKVIYDFNELDELILAWAITVHKSQGSEFPVVIVIQHTSHHIMLKRKLLYTAITRGKKLVYLIGSEIALKRSINNNQESERYSHLLKYLRAKPESSAKLFQ